METPEQKLIEVLEWLYTSEGNYPSKFEWRRELVAQLKYLAGIKEDEE